MIRTLPIAIILSVVIVAPRPQGAQGVSCDPQPNCRVSTKYDIAFMLDRSTSIANRGQTWNIMVDGLVRALRDATMIPRDGSIAVSVVVFNGGADIIVPLTEINSADAAKKVADTVQTLRCGVIGSQVFPCPFGETSWVPPILTAYNQMNQARLINPKPGARRILLMVSDGLMPTDFANGIQLAEQDRESAATQGVSLTFDAFMMGVDPQSAEFSSNKAALDQLVTPTALPSSPKGTTTVINPGSCTLPGANLTGADCSRQADEFAENTRGIIRSDVPSVAPVVGVEADTLPGAAAGSAGLSLRQAIELANCNGGKATITFNTSLRGKTIHLLSSLPALTMPDIVIDGCDPAAQGCSPLVTIDGAGQIADGISIRSNRDVVRGVRIINFTHAGILIAPACPADNIARNLVEKNVLENNPTGVAVTDQKAAPRDGFNERNTISRNNISRAVPAASAPASALIDLLGDGPTPNDAGDADQGPNTLINFPDSLNVVSSGSGTVTITGQLSGPAVTGAIVELFALSASHIVSGNVVTDGVTFLAQAKADSCSDATGTLVCTFTATGVPVSPTGNYTATVTDSLGNTSELMFRADGKPGAGPNASFNATVDFGTVTLGSSPPTKDVEIINNGNAPLQITGCALTRCAPADNDDTARFVISGCPSPTAQINPGERVTIRIQFPTNICGPAKACLILGANDLLHSPLTITLTGQVVSNLAPTVALEGNASSLSFGPVSARNQRRRINKVINKQAFHSFTVSNPGCNAFTITFASIKRVTDVPRCIPAANADDRDLWVLTQFKSGTETRVPVGDIQLGSIQIAAGETLTFRVRFNPAVPAVVNKTCPDGKLTADEVLPDTVNSVINIAATRAGVSNTLSVPLTGTVATDVRLIDPNDPSQSPVISLCRSGNDFVVQFSVYDSNQNEDHATFNFTDASGRTVGRVIDVTGLDAAIAARNLAKGQSFTVVQRFTGADDNKDVVRVQVSVFDKDGSVDISNSGPITTGCGGVIAASLQRSPPSIVALPDRAFGKNSGGARFRSRRPTPE